jgi:hypothetical protein
MMRREFALAGSMFTGNSPVASVRRSALAREMLACRTEIESAERAIAGVVSTMEEPAARVPECRAT